MARRFYSGEKRRKELQRKAKREAKQERKEKARAEGESGGGPPIDWDARVGDLGPPAEDTPSETPEEPEE